MNDPDLAQALRAAVQALQLHTIADPQDDGRPLRHFPSLDLAVVGFAPGRAPIAANVLFSRTRPEGWLADLPSDTGPVRGIQFLADVRDAEGVSIAWAPQSDWQALPATPLCGQGEPLRAPYPASLLKLMLAVGLAWCCQRGWGHYADDWTFEGERRPLRDWQFDMLAVSCNRATSAAVAWLHACGAIRRAGDAEAHNELHALFSALGLPTLRLANTQPDGGWGNAAGAGVGQIQMTAWDTVRLLWWLDPDAPPPPWLPPEAPRLQQALRDAVLRGLREQGLDTVLSSGSLAGLPGQAAGLPSRLNPRWLQADGSWRAGDYEWPGDLRPLTQTGEVRFAHKIGNTENYAADAGIVQGIAPARRHYLVAFLSNLGSRYAWHPLASGPQQLAQLGAGVDALMRDRLENRDVV